MKILSLILTIFLIFLDVLVSLVVTTYFYTLKDTVNKEQLIKLILKYGRMDAML